MDATTAAIIAATKKGFQVMFWDECDVLGIQVSHDNRSQAPNKQIRITHEYMDGCILHDVVAMEIAKLADALPLPLEAATA